MRTTITLPDDLAEDARALAQERSLSEFTRQALREHVERLKRQRLTEEMEEGYRAEAEEPSLEPGWSVVEVEGL